jgi:uncharacterized protein (TIGR02597 family)
MLPTLLTMKSLQLPTALLALGLATGNLCAQTVVTTDPVGFVSVTVKANSDALVSVPLARASEFKGTVSTIVGGLITVSGTPGWTANQFVQNLPTQPKSYVVQLASGTKEGQYLTVTASGTNTLTVQALSGENLTGIAASDQLDLMPSWTLNSMLASPPDGLEVYYYLSGVGQPATGIYKTPSRLFVYDLASTTWLDQLTEEEVGNVPLQFGTAFQVRNNQGLDYTASFVGSVPMSQVRATLATYAANTDQDIRIGYNSPVPELLSSVGFPAAEGDQLLAFNNAAVGKNKAPAILVYDGVAWLDAATEIAVPNYQLQPGYGYIYRKVGGAAATSTAWVDLQSYLTP